MLFFLLCFVGLVVCSHEGNLSSSFCPERYYGTGDQKEGVFTPEQEIRVLNFTSEDYKSSMQCTWILNNTRSNCSTPWIKFNLTNVAIELFYDSLVLITNIQSHDGEDGKKITTGTLLGMFTGRDEYSAVIPHSQIILRWMSDEETDGREEALSGFVMQWEFLCNEPQLSQDICPDNKEIYLNGDIGSSPSGVLAIENENYQNNLDCKWTIINNSTQWNGTTCRNPVVEYEIYGDIEFYDSVMVHDGRTSQDPLISRFSGTGSATSQIFGNFVTPKVDSLRRSSGNSIMVNFLTDHDTSGQAGHSGWELRYSQKCADDGGSSVSVCRPNMDLGAGPGSMHLTPEHYSFNMACGWLLTNNATSCTDPRMEVSFNYFSTEPEFDQMCVYDAPNKTNLIGCFSGYTFWDAPGVQRSTGRHLFLEFKTDGKTNLQGFHFAYKPFCQQESGNSCGGQSSLIDASKAGNLTFDESLYVNSINCSWVLYSQSSESCKDQRILLNVSMDTEQEFDTLQIWDGSAQTGHSLGVYSGTAFPNNLISTGNITLQFRSDKDTSGTHGYKGFVANYEPFCADGLSGNFRNWTCYPSSNPMVFSEPDALTFTGQDYASGLDCYWLFSAPSDVKMQNGTVCSDPVVVMDFLSFHLDDKSTQDADYLALYSSGHEEGTPQLFSGIRVVDSPGFQVSNGSNVLMKFHSNNALDGRTGFNGFTVRWDFKCPNELTSVATKLCPSASDPVISSPQTIDFMDTKYDINLNCAWRFRNPQLGNSTCTPVTAIHFSKFHTETLFDYVALYDGTNNSAPLIGSFSGKRPWDNMEFKASTGPDLLMEFHTDGSIGTSHGYAGFKALVDFICQEKSPQPMTPYCEPGQDPVIVTVSAEGVSGDVMVVSDGTITKGQTAAKNGTMIPLMYGHHKIPFSTGFPVILDNAFEDSPNSKLKSISVDGVKGQAIWAQDKEANKESSEWNNVDPTHSCCGELSPKVTLALKGAIALCVRGACPFVSKARVVQAVGAVGLIIVNSQETLLQLQGKDANDIKIPVVSALQSFGKFLRKANNTNATIFLNMSTYNCKTPPTSSPSRQPTSVPTVPQPTANPAKQVTKQPIGQPTASPTKKATKQPTGQTKQATKQPSQQPTTSSVSPTAQPTKAEAASIKASIDVKRADFEGFAVKLKASLSDLVSVPKEQISVEISPNSQESPLLVDITFLGPGAETMARRANDYIQQDKIAKVKVGIQTDDSPDTPLQDGQQPCKQNSDTECSDSLLHSRTLIDCECQGSLSAAGVVILVVFPIIILLVLFRFFIKSEAFRRIVGRRRTHQPVGFDGDGDMESLELDDVDYGERARFGERTRGSDADRLPAKATARPGQYGQIEGATPETFDELYEDDDEELVV